MPADEVSLGDPGFLYVCRRLLAGSLALPRQIKHIVGLLSRYLTQTETIAREKGIATLI